MFEKVYFRQFYRYSRDWYSFDVFEINKWLILYIDWLIFYLINYLMDLLVDWLIDWLIDWLTVDWLTDWLIDWLIYQLIHWLTVDWLTDWLINWLIDWWVQCTVHVGVCASVCTGLQVQNFPKLPVGDYNHWLVAWKNFLVDWKRKEIFKMSKVVTL